MICTALRSVCLVESKSLETKYFFNMNYCWITMPLLSFSKFATYWILLLKWLTDREGYERAHNWHKESPRFKSLPSPVKRSHRALYEPETLEDCCQSIQYWNSEHLRGCKAVLYHHNLTLSFISVKLSFKSQIGYYMHQWFIHVIFVVETPQVANLWSFLDV